MQPHGADFGIIKMKSCSVVLPILCIISSALAVPHLSVPSKRIAGRIVGGDTAKDGAFPWQAAVYYDTDAGTFFCGGALISDQWILTAGRCVDGAKIFTLHLGANSLSDADPNRVTVATANKVLHPDYDGSTFENDIGLIKLTKAVDFNDYIQPITLSSSSLDAGVSTVVSGWGQTGDWSGVSNYLNYVSLKTISNSDCSKTYGSQIKNGMVCTVGATTEGTCTGDTGSPLVTGFDTGKPVHVGTVSFQSASGCETKDPSGFTRTDVYRDWIKTTTGV